MLGTGRYKGTPMPAHLRHRHRLSRPMFERWLALRVETAAEVMASAGAAPLRAKAARIAERLQIALSLETVAPQTGDRRPARSRGVIPCEMNP
ncbi:MAG: hypothetical protein JOZ42_16280 [Acetobacteraceae bacterium]|nr:hypothetical protein [Acetobacteraceae bacterium]